MGFWIVFIIVVVVFVWTALQQGQWIRRRPTSGATKPPSRKKPWIRIERVEEDE